MKAKVNVKSIRFKILFNVLLSVTLIFVVAGISINRYSNHLLEKNIKLILQKDSLIIAEKVNSIFTQYGVLVKQMATNQEIKNYMQEIENRTQVKQHPTYGSIVKSLKEIQQMDENLALVWIALDDASYLLTHDEWDSSVTWDIHSREWYEEAKKKGDIYYTEPYKDKVTGKMVVSVIQPIFDVNKKSLGVVAIDVMIDQISHIMEQYKIGDTGYATLASKVGTVVYHPDTEKILKDTIQDMDKVGLKMLKGETGVEEYTDQSIKKYMGYAPVLANKWSISTIVNQSEIGKEIVKINQWMLVGMILAVGILFGIIYFCVSKILKPIPPLVKKIQKVASGDLTVMVDAKSQDEIGEIADANRTMVSNFKKLIEHVIESVQHVAASSQQLTATAQQTANATEQVVVTIGEIASGAVEQATHTEKTATSIEKLGDLLEKDQKYIENLNNATKEIDKQKRDGSLVLEELIEKTSQSNDATKTIYQIIISNNENVEKIEQASVMLQNISEQTNLLALNAAIEAARAGESGKGFAVVADEVGKLAEQSKRFALQINQVIAELRMQSKVSVEAVKKVRDIVDLQTASVKKVENKFDMIATAIDKGDEVIEKLNKSVETMYRDKGEIIDLVQNLAAIAEENAAGTQQVSATMEEQAASFEEITNASASLAKIAEELQLFTNQFKV